MLQRSRSIPSVAAVMPASRSKPEPAGAQYRDQAALMQFFVFIMMENQFPQFDLDGFAKWQLV